MKETSFSLSIVDFVICIDSAFPVDALAIFPLQISLAPDISLIFWIIPPSMIRLEYKGTVTINSSRTVTGGILLDSDGFFCGSYW